VRRGKNERMWKNLVQIKVEEFKELLGRYSDYIKKECREPETILCSAGQVKLLDFLDARIRYFKFVAEKGREPSYVEVKVSQADQNIQDDGWITTGYFKQDYQDTGYTCGPSSLQMALSALGCDVVESQLAKWAGTTTAGTTVAGIGAGVSKAAAQCKMNIQWSNPSFSSLGWDKIAQGIQEGQEFILHVLTYPYLRVDANNQRVWTANYGHFIYLVGVNPKMRLVKVADPTKGIRTFTYDQMASAMKAVTWANSLHILIKK